MATQAPPTASCAQSCRNALENCRAFEEPVAFDERDVMSLDVYYCVYHVPESQKVAATGQLCGKRKQRVRGGSSTAPESATLRD